MTELQINGPAEKLFLSHGINQLNFYQKKMLAPSRFNEFQNDQIQTTVIEPVAYVLTIATIGPKLLILSISSNLIFVLAYSSRLHSQDAFTLNK